MAEKIWSPEEIARDLDARAATNALYRSSRTTASSRQHMAWRVAPTPHPIDTALAARFTRLGNHLLHFYKAANRLYLASVQGEQPAWIHQLLDQGKPASLVAFQRTRSFRNYLPRIIRPDVIQTEDGDLLICELDAVPGGVGFTAQMAADYAGYGLPILGGADGLVAGFAAMIRDAARASDPSLAIVVSREADDYWLENRYLGERLTALGLRTIVVRPEALRFGDAGDVSVTEETTGRTIPIDIVYRFFELFDLANVPGSDGIQQSLLRDQIAVTPPYKSFLEEKLLFALYQHPALTGFWRAALTAETRALLDPIFPRTWVLDPAPLPPQAIYPDLAVGDAAVTDFRQLAGISLRKRNFVIKPSGFSPLAWGSRGITFGNVATAKFWQAALDEAFASFETTPYILQRYHRPARCAARYYDFAREEIVGFNARARYCPYYFVVGDETRLGGMLVTLCPLDKWALHGMTDAVLVPGGLVPGGLAP